METSPSPISLQSAFPPRNSSGRQQLHKTTNIPLENQTTDVETQKNAPHTDADRKIPDNPPKDDTNSKESRKISQDIFPQQSQLARFSAMEKSIMQEFEDVISDSLRNKCMQGPPAEIVFKEGVDVKPLHINIARPLPIHMKEEADKTLQKYIDEQIIVAVDHPTTWLSPAFWVAKADKKSVRLVSDFSHINKYIQRNTHAFAAATECIQAIPKGTAYFCSCDCLSGYFQIPLSEKASELTTFLLPNGKFKYLRCPMGLSNSSDEFLRRSDAALVNCKSFTIKLVDDLLIHAKDEKELMDRIRKVLEALRQAQITLSRKKLKISSRVKFGGMIISDAGVQPDPERIAALVKLEPPKNVKEVRGWLGAIQQLNIYHPHLALYLKSVQNLTKKGAVWDWNQDCQKAYEEVNKLIQEHLHLKFYDCSKPAILMSDASFHGYGYTLVQAAKFDTKGNPVKFDLIKAGSRTLKPVETRYSVTEIEATGLNWALGKCNYYLKGAKNTQCWVDHRPLVSLRHKNLALMTSRLSRIFEKLSDYDFELKYVKGSSHYLPDYLSRKPSSLPTKEDTVFCRAINAGSPDSTSGEGHDKSFEHLLRLAKKDKNYITIYNKILQRRLPSEEDSDEVRSFLPVWSELSISGDLLLLGDKIVIPEIGRRWILSALHAGHQGTARTLALGRVRYYWPSLSRDIRTLCQTCKHCIKYLPSQAKEPIKMTFAERPFEKLSADVFTCKGKKYLIAVDRFSSFPFCFPLTRETSEAVISKFEQLFMDLCFTPESIRTDSGTCFVGQKFQAFCKEWGISHEPSSPHFKQSNGHAESNIKKVKKLLEIHNGVYSKEFRHGLNVLRSTPNVELSTRNGFLGPSSVQLLYGRQTKLPSLPCMESCYEPISWNFASEYKKETARIRRQYYDSNARSLKELKVGQKVVVQDPINKRWIHFGEILKVQDTKRSYLVLTDFGKVWDRNRRLIRPVDISSA